MPRILLTLLIALPVAFAQAQFGKLLKEKATDIGNKLGDKIDDSLESKLEKERAGIDSTNFSYAISLNDNSGFLESDKTSDYLMRLFASSLYDEEPTAEENARNSLNMGELLYANRKYKLAEIKFTEAEIYFKEAGLENDPLYYKLISNKGLLASTMNRYTVAEEFTMEALELRKENLGPGHSSYGASLNNLAVLQKETGRYNEAEKNIEQAIEILETGFGTESMPTAIAYNNQAMLFQAMGRYDDARQSMEKAVGISASVQSEKSGNHQKFLTNYALLEQERGNYQEAEKRFKELIALKKKRWGRSHEDYAHMQKNLAALYMEMNKLEEVEPLLLDALDIYARKFGKDHRLYGSTLHDLGNFYRYIEDYDKAESKLNEARNILLSALGGEHPDFVQLQEDLAILAWKKDDADKAVDIYKEALQKSLTFIKEYFPAMSEAEKTKYWDKLRPRFERFYAFAVDNRDDNASLLKDFYNYHIATKGLLLNTTNKIKQQILTSDNQELKNLYKTWLDQKEKLARYYAYSKDELSEQGVNRDSLEQAANATEKQLSGKSDLFATDRAFNEIKFNDVRAKLNTDEALVEIVRFRKFGTQLTDEAQYAALIVKPGIDAPISILLDEGNHLETRYFKYYNNIIHQQMQDEYSYGKYWGPIEVEVADKTKLYVSTDGIYNQININTLQDPSGTYVIEKFDIVLIGNSKDLLQAQLQNKITKKAFLLGNPDFEGSAVAALPGTYTEVLNISKSLKSKAFSTEVKTKGQATEQSIKAVDSPGLLHIATHGYFLEDQQLGKGKVFGVSVESARDNPLLRAGLLLKGASHVINEEEITGLEDSNNGILTAYEASNLNLDKTKLVVLSACETGAGDLKAGEGVYGLQRAFFIAGADNLLMSLWKVDDNATQQLMSGFYKNWLNGMNMKQAFKQAQLKLKEKYPSPYYWGAFVLVGNG